MVCAQCGTVADVGSRRCVTCDSELPDFTAVVTADVTIGLSTDAMLTREGPVSSADTLAPGHKFGTRYTILKKLGAGVMGAVYQAWDDYKARDSRLRRDGDQDPARHVRRRRRPFGRLRVTPSRVEGRPAPAVRAGSPRGRRAESPQHRRRP